MREQGHLHPYQERIATFLYENDAALGVLRPGGGKTVAALTAIVDLLREGVIRHVLIIAPKRVARIVWPDEIAQWAHTAGLTYAVLAGSPAQRLAQLKEASTRNLTIIGLDVAPWLVTAMRDTPLDHPLWDLLVIDEASRLRNPTGVRAKALAGVANKWRIIWGLSGTLRPNGPQDLFMPSRIVTRGKLWGRSFWQWRKERFYATDYMGYDWKVLPGAEERINAEIAPLCIMVPEAEMPVVTPTIVIDRVELPPDARKQYDDMQRLLMTATESELVVADSAAIATGKLAQIANGFIYDENGKVNSIHTAKREWLEDLIAETTSPTLLIYEYKADLAVLRALIPDLRWLGGGVTDAQSSDNIADWNDGKLKFMALHPASGGHGLNLQFGGADMAWVSPTWSPELWEQTIARIARPGQARPVVVRVCVASGTVDEMKLDRVHHKMSAQEAFERWLRHWHETPRRDPVVAVDDAVVHRAIG